MANLHPEPITASYLIEAILLRLPAADVYRFRTVCTQWRGIIDGEGFIASHSERRAPMPLFLYCRDFSLGPLGHDDDPGLVRVDLQAVDVAARESHQVLRFRDVPNPHAGPTFTSIFAVAVADGMFKVEGSCDGILLVSYLEHVYACNPCTGHWQSLPPIHQNGGILGFYARDSDGGGRAYRVLYARGREPNINLSYRILELGAAEEPRDIGRPAFLVLFGGWPLANRHREPPTMFRGNLHWLWVLPRTITVFDTAAEEFRWIRPVLPATCRGFATQLLEIDGKLAVAAIDVLRSTIHLSVRQDGGADETWVPARLQIELLPPPAAITLGIVHHPLEIPPAFIVSQEGDVLLRCPYAMFHCDAAGDVLRQYWRPHHRIIVARHMFQESLVRHAFLPRRRGDGCNDGELPFLLPHES